MMDHGTMTKRMAMEFINITLLKKNMKENGKMEKDMGEEYIYFLMEINMMDSK